MMMMMIVPNGSTALLIVVAVVAAAAYSLDQTSLVAVNPDSHRRAIKAMERKRKGLSQACSSISVLPPGTDLFLLFTLFFLAPHHYPAFHTTAIDRFFSFLRPCKSQLTFSLHTHFSLFFKLLSLALPYTSTTSPLHLHFIKYSSDL